MRIFEEKWYTAPNHNSIHARAKGTCRADESHHCCVPQDAGLETKFWAEGVFTAVYLINRYPVKGLDGVTVEEAWSNFRPDLAHLTYLLYISLFF